MWQSYEVVFLVGAVVFSVVDAGGVFIPIIQQDQLLNPDGSYKYSYATANGVMVEEEGKIHDAGGPKETLAVEGVYTYLNSADGTLVNVRYVADEGGFRAVPNVVRRPYLAAFKQQ